MPRKKRLFALLLSLCMVVAMVPVAVLASGAGMPQNIRWAESPKSMVQWDAPSGGGQYQYELRLKLGETIIDGPDLTVQRYHLFNGSLMTEARENYTVEIRARSCIIVGEFPNEYVTSPGEWGDWATLEGSGGGGEGPTPPHEHIFDGWQKDDTNHWKECSCGEKLNVANHAYGEWSVTKPATETEEGSKARDCTVCDHVQTETIPMLEHEHGIHDETWKYDKTQHWQECSCGEKLNVANHIYGDWKVTKEATETEVGSRERGCTVCEYVQVEIIPEIGHEHGIHDETWKYDETDHWQECSCGEKLNVANHTYGDWKVTKEATETEAGSRERGCAVCEYVQTEAIPAAGTGEPTDSTDPTDSSDSQGQQDPSGDTGSPQTGDGSDMALWIGLMMASCGGVLGMLFYRRKKAAAGK